MILKKKQFDPSPAGIHNAVCVDVTPVVMKPSPWGEKPKFQVRWEIEAKMKDGKRFLVISTYSPSLETKSRFRADLKTWRGRDFTDEELNGFDVERLIGVPCQLVVVHEQAKGETYANVKTVLPAGAVKLKPSGDYQRVKDRPGYKPEPVDDEQTEPELSEEDTHQTPADDASVPF